MEVNETNTDLFLIYYFFTKSYFDLLFLAPLIITFLKILFIFGLRNSCLYRHTSNKKFHIELKEKLCNPHSSEFCMISQCELSKETDETFFLCRM